MLQKGEVTILGSGTSQGVPVIACDCEVCRSANPKDKRLRSSAMIRIGDKVIIIDTGPDFRQQMLTHQVKNLSAILYTHEHKDHVAGIDDVRSFNFSLNKAIDAYAEPRVQEALKRDNSYIFTQNKYPGIPKINLHTINEDALEIEGVRIQPIRVYHYQLPILGYRIGDFAYLTDVKTVPDAELVKLKGLKTLVITALRKEPHISHMNVEEALAFAAEIKPRKTFLIHLSHRFGLHNQEELLLPEGVKIAYDGLKIAFNL